MFSILQRDVDLVHEIEDVTGKQLEAHECEEKKVLEDITKVHHPHAGAPYFAYFWLLICSFEGI